MIYLYLTINDFSNLGYGKGSLNKKSLEKIKIIIPSKEIIKQIDDLNDENKNLEDKIKENLFNIKINL